MSERTQAVDELAAAASFEQQAFAQTEIEPVGAPFTIAHIITRFIRGGAEENTLLTCNGQAQLGHRVILIHGDDYHAQMLERLDKRVMAIEVRNLVRAISLPQDLACFFRLRELLRRHRPDIVHTHESKAGILGRFAASSVGTPLVVHGVHILAHLNESRLKRSFYRSVDWLAAKVTHLFVDVSDAMRQACVAAGMGVQDEHVVVESGMDLDVFRRPHPLEANDLGKLALLAPREPLYILIAGRLEPRKRVPELLELFAQLALQYPDVCLLIAGEGPLSTAIDERIATLGLGQRVARLGHATNLASWIGLADVCVHCSNLEGLPRVLVQYIAGGKPVIAARLPGVERLIEHGVNGYLFDPNRLDQDLPVLIGNLLEDRDLRAGFGAASARVDVSAWSRDRLVMGQEAAYRSALSRANLEKRFAT